MSATPIIFTISHLLYTLHRVNLKSHKQTREQSLPTHPPSCIKVRQVLHLGTHNKIKASIISNMNDLTSYYATATAHT